MKRKLLLLGGIVALIAPIAFWLYISSLACAFATNATNCGPSLGAFWDQEFLQIAALPWAISLGCFWGVKKSDAGKQT